MWDFLFCPLHGVLRPSNWPIVLHMCQFSVSYSFKWFWTMAKVCKRRKAARGER